MRYHFECEIHFVHWGSRFDNADLLINLSKYDYLLGTRVGEAGNPGPCDNGENIDHHDFIKLVVINPTAVFGKQDEIFGIDANCYCLAETSATIAVQKQMTVEARKNGFTPFWGPPVNSRQSFEFNRPSFRGESLGTCLMTDLPARICPLDFSEDIISSCRLSHAIVRMGCIDTLVITIYGATGYSPDARKANDYLLASAFEMMTTTRLPTLIAGDFNARPESLPCWRLFQELGYKDAFQIFEEKWGYQLPPTCNQKTRHDTVLIPPVFQPRVSCIEILNDCGFDKHSPMIVTFQLQQQRPYLEKWHMPKSWKDLNVMPLLVQSNYSQQVIKQGFTQIMQDDTLDFESLLEKWSFLCEKSVDRAIHEQNQVDPCSQPLKNLPRRFWGRCINRKKVEVQIQNPVRYSENKDYNPAGIAFCVKAKQKVKQVRRLQNLYLSMQNFFSYNHQPEYEKFLQWRNEWQAIIKAKGYGSGWDRWLLAFEPIAYIPQVLPTRDWLFSALQITKHDADATCQQEQEIRKKQFKLKLHFDRQDNYMKGTYKMLKMAPYPPVNSVETIRSTYASLNRSKKGCISLTLDDPNVKFTREREICFGESRCELLEQNGNKLKVLHIAGALPSRAYICQKYFAMTPTEVSDAFETYWTPFWNRDEVQDLLDDTNWETINDIIEKVPELPPINVVLDDVAIWEQSIAKLKSGKAAGYDGWYADDLKLLPKQAIHHLCQITSKGWQDGFNSQFMQARTILLAKTEKVEHMGHTRPITILGQIYRLMTKIAADQILNQWAHIMPPSISGGIPGRGSRIMMFEHQCRLEKIIQEKSSIAGFVLDLVKAFNCIPRRPLVRMLLNAGVPKSIITFWMTSLNRMSRLPQLGSSLGKKVFSTTGVPEGDSLSVCGMVALAYHFHEFLVGQFNQLQVNVYADN